MSPELKAEMQDAVREVVEAEMLTLAHAFVEMLRPIIVSMQEVDASLRLIVQGQGLMEKYISTLEKCVVDRMKLEREPWQQDADDNDESDA